MGLELAIAAVSLIGGGISAYSSYAAGKKQDAIAQANARIMEENAARQEMFARAQAEANARMAEAQAAAAQRNALALQEQAKARDAQSRANMGRLRGQRDRALGNQVSRVAASGIEVATGSPLDIYADTAEKYQMDIADMRHADLLDVYGINRQAGNELLTASMYSAEASQARLRGQYAGVERAMTRKRAAITRAEGRAARSAGTLGAVGAGLGAVTSAYGNYSNS